MSLFGSSLQLNITPCRAEQKSIKILRPIGSLVIRQITGGHDTNLANPDDTFEKTDLEPNIFIS